MELEVVQYSWSGIVLRILARGVDLEGVGNGGIATGVLAA